MPSNSLLRGVLALSLPTDATPHSVWDNDVWHDLTGGVFPPCYTDTPTGKLGERTLQACSTFAKNFWAKNPAEQVDYINKKSDSNDEGRSAWLQWFRANWHKFKINDVVDAKLIEFGVHPYQVMRVKKLKGLPLMEQCQISTRIPAIAEALFGDEAYDDPFTRATLRQELFDFTNLLLAATWARHRSHFSREKKTLPIKKYNLDAAWSRLTIEEATPTKVEIKKYIKSCEELVKVLSKYGDVESIKTLNENHARLDGLLQAMGTVRDGVEKTRLPKPLREALEHLATNDQIKAMSSLILGFIGRFDSDGTEETHDVVLTHNDDEIHINWQEGTESYMEKQEADLWNDLGLPDQKLPFFNEWKDPSGLLTPWSKEGQDFFNDDTKVKERLQPRWHQLAGIDRMVVRAFEGGPTLLMDEVGLGKTLQTVGVIAILAFFRNFYKEKSRFPGKFANMKWQGTDSNIPPLPSIIIVPVNIQNQMSKEFRRYLAPGSFDILPYTASLKSRASWWTSQAWSKGILSEERRIVLASVTAMASDAEAVFERTSPAWLHPKQSVAFRKYSEQTVYGRDWLVAAIDEAHSVRNHTNKTYMAAIALRKKAEVFVAMTATPLTTKLTDLWNLGRVMGLPGFDQSQDDEAKEMGTELRKAATKDRRAMRKDGGTTIRGVASGHLPDNASPSDYESVMREWISDIRDRYRGAVLRRTVNSVDNNGARISGLEPYIEHPIVMDLYPAETENLDKVTEGLAESGGSSAVKFGGGQNFYLDVRRAMTHKGCNESTYVEPKTMDDWKANPSRKLDALVEIINYHLASDGRHPLHIVNNQLVADPKYTEDPVQGTPRDKIVIFSNFPSNNEVILPVLALHGIHDVVLCNGDLSQAERAKAIEDFSLPTGPRVLILSAVGTVGLNLPMANILIILDTLWSAQEDRQLIGRVWRQPQPKPVHVYRLIAKNTPDVFLNNISFDKSIMHEAFAGCSKPMREAFEGRHHETDDEEEDEDVPVDNDNVNSQTLIKGKGKGKSRAKEAPKAKAPPKEKAPPKPRAMKSKAPAKSNVTTSVSAEPAAGPSKAVAGPSRLPVVPSTPGMILEPVNEPTLSTPVLSVLRTTSATTTTGTPPTPSMPAASKSPTDASSTAATPTAPPATNAAPLSSAPAIPPTPSLHEASTHVNSDNPMGESNEGVLDSILDHELPPFTDDVIPSESEHVETPFATIVEKRRLSAESRSATKKARMGQESRVNRQTQAQAGSLSMASALRESAPGGLKEVKFKKRSRGAAPK